MGILVGSGIYFGLWIIVSLVLGQYVHSQTKDKDKKKEMTYKNDNRRYIDISLMP